MVTVPILQPDRRLHPYLEGAVAIPCRHCESLLHLPVQLYEVPIQHLGVGPVWLKAFVNALFGPLPLS
jgi:hypothetical protein